MGERSEQRGRSEPRRGRLRAAEERQSSRPGGFRPQPLTEPYVIVSHHTAVAYVQFHGAVVVTNEQPRPDSKTEIKLPDVGDPPWQVWRIPR